MQPWQPAQQQPMPSSPRMIPPPAMPPGVLANMSPEQVQVRYASPRFGGFEAPSGRYPSPQMLPQPMSPQGIFMQAPLAPPPMSMSPSWDHRWVAGYPLGQPASQEANTSTQAQAPPSARSSTPVRNAGDGSASAAMNGGAPKASIGITCGRTDNRDLGGAVYILAIHPTGPAARKGVLEPMQELVSVDGWSVVGQSMSAITEKVVGPAGSHVSLEVCDPSSAHDLDIRPRGIE
jgi:hypothetical protein